MLAKSLDDALRAAVKQERLPLPREMQVIEMPTVQRLPSMTKALVLCADMGGFENDKEFCREIDIDPAVWSQIQAGVRYFPQDKYERLFEACANEVPLMWLADRRGYVLTPKETEMERRLRITQEALAKEKERSALLAGLLQGRAVA
jgi:hypothetical protein